MAVPKPLLDLLLVDDDEVLIADAESIGHTAINMVYAADAAAARQLAAAGRFDAVMVNVGLSGGFELVEQMARNGAGLPVIAIAAAGTSGHMLEHALTVAELRGARMALPKPIDAIELVAAAAQVAHAARDAAGMAALQRELEARLGFEAVQAA